MTEHPFDPAALQHVVARTLAESPDIPEGARGAFLLVGNRESLKAVIAVKVGGDWEIHAMVEHQRESTGVDYGVSITGTW